MLVLKFNEHRILIPKSQSTPEWDVDFSQGVPPYNPAKRQKI